jgi:two-component system, NtrC family, sensor histidine kinase GlrK
MSPPSKARFRLSLSLQLVAAMLLAILPLVVAVAFAAWALAEQTRTQHQLVLSMSTLNQLDAAVSEQVRALERAARQYRLLREPRFQDRYKERLAQLRSNRDELASMDGLEAESATLIELVQALEQVGARLEPQGPSGGAPDDLQPLLQQAYELSAQLSAQVARRLEASLAAGEEQFNATFRRLVLIGSLAIPGTVLLVALGSLAIATPVRRLVRTIRNLGHRRWQEPIAIQGPAELQELGEWLDWMRRKLLASEQRSQAFMRYVTHELKNPLAAISEASSLLADEVPGDLSPAQQRVLAILQDKADTLDELIRQLLSYHMASQDDGTEREKIDLPVFCVDQQARFEVEGRARGIRWLLQGPPLTVVANRVSMQMIVTNLYSNAIDYSPRNGEVCVEWGTDGDRCWLSVADQGPGIPEAEQRNIFKPFVRGTARRRGHVKGSGIGLAIVDQAVKALGGSVAVSSRPGEGSRFRVEWPLTDALDPQ